MTRHATPPGELTDRQAEIYAWIESEIVAHSRPPSVREIAAHFGVRSPNGVLCTVRALEKAGRIRFRPGSRGIELVHDPRKLTRAKVEAAVGALFRVGDGTHDFLEVHARGALVALYSRADVTAILSRELGVEG